MVDLENLLVSESETTSAIIQRYIESENERLRRLQEFAENYQSQNGEVPTDDTSFVTNPVNAYLLIKRLTSDWKYIKQLMSANNADRFIRNITQGRLENSVMYPDEEDLDGAAVGLLRLQDTYQLKTDDLANGIVAGESVGNVLTAQDCFEVGRAAYNNRDYYHTLEWMQEALDRRAKERPPTVAESDILEYLAYAMYQQGNPKRALALTKRLHELDPMHPRAAGNIEWYNDMLNADDKRDMQDLPPVKNERQKIYDIKERDDYEKLCRGEFDYDPAMASKVYCYLKRDKPFLKLAPLKVEILRFEPLVVLFKNVVSDYEVSVIKQLATPRLKRATVQNAKTGELETASYRISKSAWLKEYEHPVVARVNARIADMTNLNQETSEDLQVANYGIGGHYDPHFDFARKEEKNAFKKLGTGNRIATVLFYMSQPEKGGATVYTELGQGVFPTLHDALFWYNLRRNGDGDLRTRHAACPVLTGVKWVSNKWIHERGQEFTRPCGLTEGASEQFVGDLTPQ
ncbi:Prolyl 4-hydroxylase alpha-1 subunit precursor [Aphelenchoides avenae]|nr:Prolyl 4-hydroxylase alpha-1 subunit precursor [Aphelenchus avenae]